MLKPGLTHEIKHRVQKHHLASQWESGLAEVLATPMLVAFCEECARLTVEPHLSPGQQTVGTWVNLRHLAATPEGMQVTIRTELVKVEERRLHFRFEAWDELEKIGEGEHERFVIDVERFQRRVSEKASTSIRPSEH